MQPPALLVIDDDADVLKAAAATLARSAERVDTAGSPEGVAERAHLYDAVLLDMNFAAGARDGAAGLDTLDRLHEADPALSVILMTTYGGVSNVGTVFEVSTQGMINTVFTPSSRR